MSMKKLLLITCVFFIALTGHVYSQIDTVNLDPAAHNFNIDMLSELHSEINDNAYGEVHSLLIVRNGDLVFEEYYNGYSRQQLHSIFSITKTITSALIGIAIDQGKIESVDEYMLDFFPEYTLSPENSYLEIQNNNDFKKAIQLKHLLTMTSGIDKEDGSTWTGGDNTSYQLNAPVNYEPGEVWNYCNGCAFILSKIIKNKTGRFADSFAAVYLFKPLGITNWSWIRVSDMLADDLPNTAGGIQLRPLDLALFGQLYLQKGVWNGNQIISENWIEESVKVQVDYAKDDRSYGYLLYQFVDTSSVSQMLQTKDVFFAVGAQQQRMYVIPHLECVVVINGNYADPKTILTKVLYTMNDGTTSIVSPDDKIDANSFHSFENYPNPFKQSTTITYNLNKSDIVIVEIYNRYGQVIDTLVNDIQKAGKHEVTWHSKGLPKGIYFCKLQADEFSETKKLILY